VLAVEDTASRPGVGCLGCSTAAARGCRGRSSIRWPTSTGCSPPVPASVWGSELTAKLLSVIGIPAPGAELTTSLWSSTRSIDFEVPDVSEEKLDLGALGKALIGRTIGTSPATQDLLRQPRRAHAADNPNSGQPAHRDPFHLRSRPVFRGFSGRDRNLIGKATHPSAGSRNRATSSRSRARRRSRWHLRRSPVQSNPTIRSNSASSRTS
jgi:hypothetical protein